MKLNLLITSLLALCLATGANASTEVKPTYITNLATTPSCMIPINSQIPLTTEAVDYYWAKRENTTCQTNLINYLIAKPALDLKKDSNKDYELAWKTAHLIYFVGNFGVGEKAFSSNGAKKDAAADFFKYGVEKGKLAKKLQPEKVEGYYWYAVDLGSYGLAKGIIAAASGASDGIKALKKVVKLDASYENYGAYRVLGRYYHALPMLFGGDDKIALKYLNAATQNANYKVNWVYLGNFYYDKGEYSEAFKACTAALKVKASDNYQQEDKRYTSEANICVFKAANKLKQKG